MLFEGWKQSRLFRRYKEIDTPTPHVDRKADCYTDHLNPFFFFFSPVKILFLIYKSE